MLKSKFCIVGVDKDIQEFIFENKRNYLGLVSNLKGKNYKFGRVIGGENLSDWLKIKKYNPDVFILVDEGSKRKIT